MIKVGSYAVVTRRLLNGEIVTYSGKITHSDEDGDFWLEHGNMPNITSMMNVYDPDTWIDEVSDLPIGKATDSLDFLF